MGHRYVLSGIMFLIVMGAPVMQCQTQAKLVLDKRRPIVYVEFDHAGPREQVENGESAQGLWLRLVNNSVVPIEVERIETTTKSGLILLPDVIIPITKRIPLPGVVSQEMPMGYASGMGAVQTIAPGRKLVFSVPANHVSPNWYMQVPFHFSLPPVKEGAQPICYAFFTWEDLPESYRSTRTKDGTDTHVRSPDTILHESNHADPGPRQPSGHR